MALMLYYKSSTENSPKFYLTNSLMFVNILLKFFGFSNNFYHFGLLYNLSSTFNCCLLNFNLLGYEMATIEKNKTIDKNHGEDRQSSNNKNSDTELISLTKKITLNGSLGKKAIVAKSSVPESHRSMADSYRIIKKVFGSIVIFCPLTKSEKELLNKFDFKPLEMSSGKEIKRELDLLVKWASSINSELSYASEKIIEIRCKELKNIMAKSFVKRPNSNLDGYKLLETYFENISKY